MPKGVYKHPSRCGFQKGHTINIGKKYRWKGGKIKNENGYILIYKPEHPFAKYKYIYEHRLIVEKYLKRYLLPKEECHHINEIKDDNRIKNLIVFANHGYHIAFHRWRHCNIKGIIFDGRKLK